MSKDPFTEDKKIHENEHAFSLLDGYPVTEGHMLVVPKRKVPEIFDLTDKEYQACFDLVRVVKDYLMNKYGTKSFNIGINCGTDAGQTIFHAHIHIIPRYKNDVTNPRGGVRNVIPNKADY